MATISVDKLLFDELLAFKLRKLTEEIQEILEKWHYSSGHALLQDAQSGQLKESEMDAIELRQLLHEQETLLKVQEKEVGISSY
jgi:hypothetical protein